MKLLALLALAAPAAAQTIYVDVGANVQPVGLPPASYSAAAAVPGLWNAHPLASIPLPMYDAVGTHTDVTLQTDITTGTYTVAHDVPDPDDAMLMRDYQRVTPGVGAHWEFAGLDAGVYDLYTYSLLPLDNLAGFSTITVERACEGAVVLGGDWPDGHVEGVGYMRHTVAVTDGSIRLTVQGVGSDAGIINGFQLVCRFAQAGTNFCTPAVPNSTGNPGALALFASPIVADDLLVLHAEALPALQFGYFLVGTAQASLPGAGGSQGVLCLGGTLGRFTQDTGPTTAAGEFTVCVSPNTWPVPGHGAVLGGETWHFQLWHRDLNPQPTSNFSSAATFMWLQ